VKKFKLLTVVALGHH